MFERGATYVSAKLPLWRFDFLLLLLLLEENILAFL